MRLIKPFRNKIDSLANVRNFFDSFCITMVLCQRGDNLSVVLAFKDYDVFESLVSDVPIEISSASSKRWAVELQNEPNKFQKFWVDHSAISAECFEYDSSNNLIENKLYKIQETNKTFIDRFDALGNKTSSNEEELIGSKANWTGSEEIADIADSLHTQNCVVQYTYRTSKSQSYIALKRVM